MKKAGKNKLQVVHTRLFKDDVETLKAVAEENGGKWQIELRQLVRRALRGERKEIVVLKESNK